MGFAADLNILFPDKVDGILENGESHPLFGQLFPRPARVVGAVEIGFRMRHQAEYPSRLIADPGDAVDGAVRICRIIHHGIPEILMAVFYDNLMIPVKSF